MSEKRTPWFPAKVRPARPGVYERDLYGETWYSFWSGEKWSLTRSGPKEAMSEAGITSGYQCDTWDCPRWRGLAEKPE